MNKRRVLFCLDSTAYLRHLFPVINRFADSDLYEVEVIIFKHKAKLKENSLDKLLSKVNNVYWIRESSVPRLHQFFQEFLSLLLFLNSSHASPQLLSRTPFPKFIRKSVRLVRIFPKFSSALGRILLKFSRSLYLSIIPLSSQYKFFFEYFKLNSYSFVFSAPYLFPNTPAVPMQLACKNAGLPLVGQIASWDNLSTKGTWVVKPDTFFVWNSAMKRELSLIHPGITELTSFYGSPTFEDTFSYKPALTRQEFFNTLCIPYNSNYILYLCSSPTIGNSNEDRVLLKLISLLTSSGILSDANRLVIRTHPLLNLQESEIYKNPSSFVTFYPAVNTSPNLSSDANDQYLSSIEYSKLVIGQNTSAFLDACLLDKPCITLPSYPGLYDKDKFGHIKLLLDGNFIHQPTDDHQLSYVINRILSDDGDSLESLRSSFIESFLHPSSQSPSVSIFNHLKNLYK